jgi:hypothetical protein
MVQLTKFRQDTIGIMNLTNMTGEVCILILKVWLPLWQKYFLLKTKAKFQYQKFNILSTNNTKIIVFKKRRRIRRYEGNQACTN